jgi:hypothetical protein
MPKIKKTDDHIADLDKIIEKGKIISKWEGSDSYKLITDWIEKQCNMDKILSAPKEERDEGIGYMRALRALLKQFEIWKNLAKKKQVELNKLLDKKNE